MGKSSKQTIGYWYHPAFHMGLGYGPADALLEIRGGDKTAWSGELTASGTITINAPNLFGGEKDQGGIAGDMDVMFGEPTQQPNAYLTATFGNQQPAWRGLMTVAFKGGRYGAMNPYPQKISYKWRKIKMGWDGDPGNGSACWYPEKAAVVLASDTTLPPDSTGWEYQILPAQDNPGYTNLDIPTTGWTEGGQTPFAGGILSGNTGWPINTVLWARRSVTITGINQTLNVAAENGCVVFINGAIAGAVNRANPDIDHNEQFPVNIPLNAGATIDLVIKAFDEANATGGGTELDVSIFAAGLTAMNPAHILYYARTQQHMGREPTANMNDASFKAAADWYYAQGFGLCTTYDASQESIDAFIERIEKVAGCSMTRSPADGLWYLDVANGQYDIDSLPVLADDDILAFTMQPATLDSAINSVSVQYFDPQQKTTVSTRPVEALALVSAYGRSHQDTSYPEIPTSDLALRVAQRDLQSTATPTHGFEITATRVAHAWRKGTYFRMQAPKHGVADMVCIVGDPDSGTLASGAIKFTAVEDIYSLPASSFAQQETGVDTRPPQIPLAVAQQVAFEAPYFQLVRNLSRPDLAALPADVGYLQTVAAAPGPSRDYSITVSTNGGTSYADTGARGAWCPTALIVEGDPLTSSIATAFTLSGGALVESVAVGSAALWDGEIVRVDAIDATAGTLTLGRGCADTVPVAHAANSRIWFFDGFTGTDSTEYAAAEAIDVELLTNTGSAQLDPSLAMPIALTFGSRQSRPYPAANFQINGSPWCAVPDIVNDIEFTWVHRDRITQADQLVDYSAASVGPESGVTYKVDVYLNGALDSSTADISGTSFTPTISADGTVHVVLTAQRAGVDCLQPAVTNDFHYQHATLIISNSAPDGAPGATYDFTYVASGGVAPYTWSIVSGALPGGLTIDTGTGEITGTPTTAGNYSYTVQVEDSASDSATLDEEIAVAFTSWDAAKTPSSITRTSDTLLTNKATGYNSAAANAGKSAGKWLFQTKGSNRDYFVGIAAAAIAHAPNVPWQNGYFLGNASPIAGNSIGFENYNGELYWDCENNGTHGATSNATGVGAAAWLTIAVDLDNWTIKIFSGDTLLNSLAIPAQLQGMTYYPACSLLYSGDTCQLNAGQSTIAVPAPLAGLGYNAFW